jgi:DNA repair exonuclease SbcCD ATPase subunit
MSDPQPGRTAPTTAQAGDKTDIEPIDEKRFTQADLDALIRDRLERQRRALEAQRREEQQAAEAQKLEDTQEFEKLAKQRAKEIESLKPRAGLAESYEKGVSRLIGEATKALPSNIQMILNKLSLVARRGWPAAATQR